MEDKKETAPKSISMDEDAEYINVMLNLLAEECGKRDFAFVGTVAMRESAMVTMKLPPWFAVQIVDGKLQCVKEGQHGVKVEPENTLNIGSGMMKMLGGIANAMGAALNNVIAVHKVITPVRQGPQTAPGNAPNIILPPGAGIGGGKKHRKH